MSDRFFSFPIEAQFVWAKFLNSEFSVQDEESCQLLCLLRAQDCHFYLFAPTLLLCHLGKVNEEDANTNQGAVSTFAEANSIKIRIGGF